MRVLATKSDAEREDDEASRLVREAPRAKPPRRDRRRERMDTQRDPDTAGDPDLKGKDTSLNYKSIGGSTVERLALRFAVSLTARENPRRGSKRKNKIPARSKDTGDKVFISPETLRSEPGKYEKWKPGQEDEDYSPFDAVKDVQNSPSDEASSKPEKQPKPKVKKTKGKPPPATEFEPQVVKRTDEPSEDDHEYEEIDLDDDEKENAKAEGEPKAEREKKTKPKKPKAKPKSKGDDGKGEGKGDDKPAKPEAKRPAPEPTVADRLGIKPPQQREASAEERAEAALVLADTLPPELAARLIAKGIHPDDAKTVVSSYRAANARPLGNPGEFAAKAAKVYQTDPDKVEPPKSWRTAEGKRVPFEELAPDEQASAYRQHQMQVVAVSLAAQGQLEEKLTFGGAMPADIAKVVTASMLGGGKGDPHKVFEAVTETAGFSRIADGTAKQMLAAVKGNDTAHALVQAFLEANDYKKAKDLYLGKGTFSERDDPKSIADGLRSARDFFKVRGSAYGGDGHEGAKRFETKVLAKLREIEPKKYQEVRRTLDEEDARAYEASLKAYRKARADYDKQKKVYDRLPNARRGDEPTAPVAPIEPANYSNAKKPDQLKGEGRELWDDLFDRAGVKKTGAVVASKYLISSYLNRIAMDRTSDDRSKRALYHGLSPGAGYVREPYPAPTQVPSRGLAEADFEKILASAQQWLGSPVLTQGMTGLAPDEKSRFALDLALSDGAYNLDATAYETVLARLLGTADRGSVLKTAATALETQIFRKFPPDSKSKAGGRLNVMLTGAAAKVLKKPSYTTIALGDLPAADLQKLAETMNVRMASEHSSSSFASAGEATTSTTSNGRPITETVNMLRLSSEQKTSANQSLATIDKTAQLIQDNYKAWGIPFKIAKEMVNRLDKTADAVESLVYGERSLQNRQAEVAVQSEDFVKEALTEGLISKGEFAKAAKVIQRDSDESYMETFANPHKPIETDADEPYMSAYGDDQSSAVNNGEDSTGRDLAP